MKRSPAERATGCVYLHFEVHREQAGEPMSEEHLFFQCPDLLTSSILRRNDRLSYPIIADERGCLTSHVLVLRIEDVVFSILDLSVRKYSQGCSLVNGFGDV